MWRLARTGGIVNWWGKFLGIMVPGLTQIFLAEKKVNKPEQQFWKLLKDHLPGDFSRIENYAESGMPDVNGGWIGNPYWIELKVSKNIGKFAHPKTLCEAFQLAWHARRCKHDNNIFVMTQYHNALVVHRVYPIGKYREVMVFKKEKNKWPWVVFEAWFKEAIKIKD